MKFQQSPRKAGTSQSSYRKARMKRRVVASLESHGPGSVADAVGLNKERKEHCMELTI